MRRTIERTVVAIVALFAAATWQSVDAQTSRQAQVAAERARTTAVGGVKACTLLSNAEIRKLTGRTQPWELNDEPYDMGSACDWGGGIVTLRVFSSNKPEDEVSWTLKNYKKENEIKQAIAGFGAGAYVMYPKRDNEYADVVGILVGRAGARMFMLSLMAPDGKSAGSVQPQLVTLAKTVAARLEKRP